MAPLAEYPLCYNCIAMSTRFRRARADDRELLDEITLAGIRYWGHDQKYPEAYHGLARALLEEAGPESHPVFVLEDDGEVIGFYELRDRGDHVELLRMFLRSEVIGQGYGRVLWDHAVEQAGRTNDRMLIKADPDSIGFYSAMGARLEKRQEVAPGFSLGICWYDLTEEHARHNGA